ncbi:MAG: hypothetical protein V8S96_05980 [Lachnospiraceae bacterium]
MRSTVRFDTTGIPWFLTEGENNVRVFVTDNEQYTAEKTFTLTYSPTGDKDDDGKDQELQIHFVLKADNVGLGTLIDENIKVKPGTRLGRWWKSGWRPMAIRRSTPDRRLREIIS